MVDVCVASKTKQVAPEFTVIDSSDSDGDSVHKHHPPSVKSRHVIDLDIDTPSSSATSRSQCIGISLEVPANSDPYLAYPLGLHKIKPIPWKPTGFEDMTVQIRAHSCTGIV